MNSIEIKGQQMTYQIMQYLGGGLALMLWDELGAPEGKLSTNPVFHLPSNVIAVRNDSLEYMKPHLDALIKAGVLEIYAPKSIENVQSLAGEEADVGYGPKKQVLCRIGRVWATMYKVNNLIVKWGTNENHSI